MIRLFQLPHHEARALLATSEAPVFLSINPVEFHGPHLPLWTDHLITQGLSRALHERLSARRPEWPYVVADELASGVEPATGPGSRFTSYPQLKRQVEEACKALLEMGARRVVLNTFHGHPLHSLALHAGVETVRRGGGRAVALLPLALHEMISLDAGAYREVFDLVDADDETKARVRDGLRFDFHAGFFETSLMMHFEPASVSLRHRDLPPCPKMARSRPIGWLARLAGRLGKRGLSEELDFLATATGWGAIRPYPGYTGWPSLASAEVGAWFAARLLDKYEEEAGAVLIDGRAPVAPPMTWMAAVTLAGRLHEPHPRHDQMTIDPPPARDADSAVAIGLSASR